MTSSLPLPVPYLVVPGQVIAVANHGDAAKDSFLRGHGTFLETTDTETRLIASVTGVVQRVNQLISVHSACDLTLYQGQVGDLVVGRITSVSIKQWKVELLGSYGRQASLPLSGVHLPGGVQRMRTAEDSRDMRLYLQPGDLVSAEVHKVQLDGTLLLHTRSTRYGKLENGCLVVVPPKLVPRRKNHYTTVLDQFTVLWGCNGMIWMQRKMTTNTELESGSGGPELAELQEKRRQEHADTPMSVQERQNLARLRNAVECLRMVHCLIASESVEQVYLTSLERKVSLAKMLWPDNVIRLTAKSRRGDSTSS
jgi:exosome complex component RRP4